MDIHSPTHALPRALAHRPPPLPLSHQHHLATQQPVLTHQVWVDGAGHNDIESRHHAVFLKGIRMFLDHCSEMRQLQGR